MADFAQLRRNMVDCQLRTYAVTDLALLEAMSEVPRELFVPPDLRVMAYIDRGLPIGHGEGAQARELLAPMIFARMIQAARPTSTDRVLDVACGLGYSTAILAGLTRSVVGLEPIPALASGAERALRQAGIGNAMVVSGALDEGHSAGGPYDLIVVNGAFETKPVRLLAQLARGGRLVGISGLGRTGRIVVMLRAGEEASERVVIEAVGPALPAFRAEPGFVF